MQFVRDKAVRVKGKVKKSGIKVQAFSSSSKILYVGDISHLGDSGEWTTVLHRRKQEGKNERWLEKSKKIWSCCCDVSTEEIVSQFLNRRIFVFPVPFPAFLTIRNFCSESLWWNSECEMPATVEMGPLLCHRALLLRVPLASKILLVHRCFSPLWVPLIQIGVLVATLVVWRLAISGDSSGARSTQARDVLPRPGGGRSSHSVEAAVVLVGLVGGADRAVFFLPHRSSSSTAMCAIRFCSRR